MKQRSNLIANLWPVSLFLTRKKWLFWEVSEKLISGGICSLGHQQVPQSSAEKESRKREGLSRFTDFEISDVFSQNQSEVAVRATVNSDWLCKNRSHANLVSKEKKNQFWLTRYDGWWNTAK